MTVLRGSEFRNGGSWRRRVQIVDGMRNTRTYIYLVYIRHEFRAMSKACLDWSSLVRLAVGWVAYM